MIETNDDRISTSNILSVQNPFHENSQIHRLLDLTLDYICRNIEQFDFEGFPDEFLIK